MWKYGKLQSQLSFRILIEISDFYLIFLKTYFLLCPTSIICKADSHFWVVRIIICATGDGKCVCNYVIKDTEIGNLISRWYLEESSLYIQTSCSLKWLHRVFMSLFVIRWNHYFMVKHTYSYNKFMAKLWN